MRPYSVSPEDFGLDRVSRRDIQADGVEDSMQILREVLQGYPGPARNVVLANAAAALLAADRVSTLEEGVSVAAASIDSGAARGKLDMLVRLSQGLE